MPENTSFFKEGVEKVIDYIKEVGGQCEIFLSQPIGVSLSPEYQILCGVYKPGIPCTTQYDYTLKGLCFTYSFSLIDANIAYFVGSINDIGLHVLSEDSFRDKNRQYSSFTVSKYSLPVVTKPNSGVF